MFLFYFLMRTQNHIYEIKGGILKLKKTSMEVPVSEIKGIDESKKYLYCIQSVLRTRNLDTIISFHMMDITTNY